VACELGAWKFTYFVNTQIPAALRSCETNNIRRRQTTRFRSKCFPVLGCFPRFSWTLFLKKKFISFEFSIQSNVRPFRLHQFISKLSILLQRSIE
jgi:hypothetical protein